MADFLIEYLKEVEESKKLQDEEKKESHQSEIFSNEEDSGIKKVDQVDPKDNGDNNNNEGKFPPDEDKNKKDEKKKKGEEEPGQTGEEKKIKDAGTIVKDK
jgi:hypothetical protein